MSPSRTPPKGRVSAIVASGPLSLPVLQRNLILFVALVGVYFFIGRVILLPRDWPTIRGWEVVSIDPLQADTQLVIENLTGKAATHTEWAQRSSILHPLLKLMIAPIGSVIAGRIGASNTGLLLSAIFASLSVLLLRIMLNQLNRFHANLFTAIYAFSATVLLYAGLPETFMISCVSIQLLILCANRHIALFLSLSVVAIGTLIANIIPVMLIYAYRRKLSTKPLILIDLLAFAFVTSFLVISGMQIQSLIYPSAASPLESRKIIEEQKVYFFASDSLGSLSNRIVELASATFLTNIASAPPVVSRSIEGPMLKWGSPFASIWDKLMKIGWITLLIHGIGDWKRNRLQLLLLSLIGFYVVLFFAYGDSNASFLYGPCWTALFIGAIAMNPGYQVVSRKSALLCCGFLILQVLTNLANLILFAGMMATENW